MCLLSIFILMSLSLASVAAGWSESGRCTDGHDIECQWQMNPHGNVEVSQRGVTVWVVEEGPAGAVKKILLLTTKAANSWKYVGQMLQYPSEMRGLVASVTRYDENDNEITKGTITFVVCGVDVRRTIIYHFGADGVGTPILVKNPDARLKIVRFRDQRCLRVTFDQTSSFGIFEPPEDTGCPLDLMIVAGQPNLLTAYDFQHLRAYLRARVDTFLTNHPNYYVGIIQYSNGALLVCPMDNDKQALHQCINNAITNHPQMDTPYIGTEAAIRLAGRRLNDWFNDFKPPNRPKESFAVEVVLPGSSNDHPGGWPYRRGVLYDEDQLDTTYFVLPNNYDIHRMHAVGWKAPASEILHELERTYLYTVVPTVEQMEEYGRIEVRLCPDASPSPSASPDCILEDGDKVTLHCPYETILMEHCYKCFDGSTQEVVVCPGWSKEDIWEQCYSPVPLPSPSPEPVWF